MTHAVTTGIVYNTFMGNIYLLEFRSIGVMETIRAKEIGQLTQLAEFFIQQFFRYE
jgi:hypothetical protein